MDCSTEYIMIFSMTLLPPKLIELDWMHDSKAIITWIAQQPDTDGLL
jgi:hypothetical protein